MEHILLVIYVPFFIMKKIIGFAMFFAGFGILIGQCISKDWVCVCFAMGLMCVGYRMFCK